MIATNFRCSECGHVYEVFKQNVLDDFPNQSCPMCLSKETYRVWGIGDISICEGNVGNASTGYSKSMTYHPSKYGHVKGKTIKKI
jgi:rubredoxin